MLNRVEGLHVSQLFNEWNGEGEGGGEGVIVEHKIKPRVQSIKFWQNFIRFLCRAYIKKIPQDWLKTWKLCKNSKIQEKPVRKEFTLNWCCVNVSLGGSR